MRRKSHTRQLSEPIPQMDFLDSPTPSSFVLKTSSPTLNALKACFTGMFLMPGGFRFGVDDQVRECYVQKEKSVIERQKRKELGQEVANLQKLLQDEEKLHEILERALLPSSTRTTINIPSLLPKKTKELLAEVLMVEEEIARLESEISKIQHESSRMQNVKDESLKIDRYVNNRKFFNTSFDKTSTTTRPPLNRGTNEKLARVAGPMLTEGDYTLRDFIHNEECQREVEFQDRIPRISGVAFEQSSPKPPRNSSPRQADTKKEMLLEQLREPSIAFNPPDRNSQFLQPNRLSEKIMKCLIFIFLRSMKTPRASETERLVDLSWSPTSSLRLRSFLIESGYNSKTSSSTSLNETGQQDPYGIFETQGSLFRDIGPYKNLVMCTSSSLDSKKISSFARLLGKLRDLKSDLCHVDLRFLTHHQKLAFWINIYNACIMHGFLEHGLPTSPAKIIALRNKAVLNVGGNILNAFAIEHFILKQPSKRKDAYLYSDRYEKEDVLRNIYGLEHPDPNITFALCSGTKSSPSVKIYTADGISAELEKSKVEYLQASIVVTASKRLMIPELLESNAHEFATDLGSLVVWIRNQLPRSGSLRKSMTERLKDTICSNVEISDIVDIMPYCFEFQYLLSVNIL